jgi:hypothetical protein
MDPATATTLAIGTAAAGTATSAVQAAQRNQAIEASRKSQKRAARIQSEQVENQAEQRREQLADKTAQIQGRIRVAKAESGVGMGGTTAALQRETALQRGENLATIDENLRRQQQAIQSGAAANLAQLGAEQQSPALSGFQGGLGGLQTGLAIGGGLNQLDRNAQANQTNSRLESAQRQASRFRGRGL